LADYEAGAGAGFAGGIFAAVLGLPKVNIKGLRSNRDCEVVKPK